MKKGGMIKPGKGSGILYGLITAAVGAISGILMMKKAGKETDRQGDEKAGEENGESGREGS